jgi:hypothetical protein
MLVRLERTTGRAATRAEQADAFGNGYPPLGGEHPSTASVSESWAQRALEEAEDRVANLRTAIEGGADASLVSEWLEDAKRDRDSARKASAAAKPAVLDVRRQPDCDRLGEPGRSARRSRSSVGRVSGLGP